MVTRGTTQALANPVSIMDPWEVDPRMADVWRQTAPQNPCLFPPLLILGPPPSSGLNLSFVSHKKFSFQVTPNFTSLGSFRGLGTYFVLFLWPRNRVSKPFIFVGKLP